MDGDKVEMKAVILAAGVSKRLRPITERIPKCLLEIDRDVTILSQQLDNLLALDIKDIIIVVGYKRELISQYIFDHKKYRHHIKMLFNENFEKTDNAFSLSLALDQIDASKDSVIVLDGDVVFDILLLKKLLLISDKNALIANNNRTIDEEDSKVKIRNGYAIAIGKKIKGEAIYSSMIKMGGEFLSVFQRVIREPRNKLEWYSEPLNRVLNLYPAEVRVILTNGLITTEIDTFQDLIYARKIYKLLRKTQ